MKIEHGGYRLGDRVQVVAHKDPHAPLLPGAKGTIETIDDMGTLHMRWDNGRTLGIVLGEDEIRPIRPEQEWSILNSASSTLCDEEVFDAGREEVASLLGAIDAYAHDKDGAWVVKRTFLDEGHQGREPVYEFTGTASITDILQSCDQKNGVDIAYAVKRPAKQQSMMLIAYGQNYTLPDGKGGTVTELLECKLASPAAARDFEERIDIGWDPRGDGAMRLFASPGDHESLADCIRACKEAVRDITKAPDMER